MKIFKIFLTLIFILFLNSCDDKNNHSFGVVNLNLSNSQDFEDSNSLGNKFNSSNIKHILSNPKDIPKPLNLGLFF